MPKRKDKPIDKQIEEENQRLLMIFSGVPEKELNTVAPLIQNASFLKVTLARLQTAINTGEVVEDYQNGQGQSGRKTSSELQTYNNLIKDYSSIISKLLKLIPKESPVKEDKFEKFLRGDFDFDDDL